MDYYYYAPISISSLIDSVALSFGIERDITVSDGKFKRRWAPLKLSHLLTVISLDPYPKKETQQDPLNLYKL